jgi:hypothetical protein
MSTHRLAPLGGTRALLALVVLLSSMPVHALGGLMYRAASSGRWVGIAMTGEPLPPGSMYAGGTFKACGKKPTLASITECGSASLVAFCAQVRTPSTFPNPYAVFLYDAATGTIHDVAQVTTCSSSHDPVIVIDPSACQAHVIYPDGKSGSMVIRDAAFSLPGLTLSGITTLVEDLTTSAPPPFASGAVLHLPSTLPLSATYAPGPGVVVAFYAHARGPGLSSAANNRQGIFSWATGGTLTTHARTGDPGCPPPWPDAGAVYTSFGHAPSAAALTGPAVAFVAHSSGAASKDTAIVLNESGCSGTNVVQAAEHSDTPLGGKYDDLMIAIQDLAGAANGTTVFMAKITGVPGTTRALIRSTGEVVARHGFADTALGAAVVGFSSHPKPAINSAGAIVFTPHLSGFRTGTVLYDTPATLPELITLNGAYPQIDDLGNMVVAR